MSLQEFYKKINGNYSNVVSRLQSETSVIKFLKAFLKDSTFNNLKEALRNGDIKQAFIEAHTLKGLVLTLELGSMRELIQTITEKLRNSNNVNPSEFEELKKQYNEIVNLIETL